MTVAEPIDPHRVKTRLTPEDRAADSDAAPLATALGLFSLALGLAEVLTPHKVAARTGVPYPALIRAFGLRELAAGVGILTARRPGPWLWARVAPCRMLSRGHGGLFHGQAASFFGSHRR